MANTISSVRSSTLKEMDDEEKWNWWCMQEANWGGHWAAQWNDRGVCTGGIYWSQSLRLRNTNAYHQRSINKRVSSASAKAYSFQMSAALAHSGGNPCSLLLPQRCIAARVMLAAPPACPTWTWTWVGKCQSTWGAQGQREESTNNQPRQLRKKLLNMTKVICIKMVSRTF